MRLLFRGQYVEAKKNGDFFATSSLRRSKKFEQPQQRVELYLGDSHQFSGSAAGSSSDESCTSFALLRKGLSDPPPSPCRCGTPQEKTSSSLKKNPSFLESKAIYIESHKSHYDFLFFLIFFSVEKLQSPFKTAFPWTSSIIFDASFHLRRLVSTNSCPTSVGKPWSYLVQEVVDVGDFDGRRGGGWTCGKPPRFFYVLRFFFVLVVFFCGGGKEKKRMETQLFLGGGT